MRKKKHLQIQKKPTLKQKLQKQYPDIQLMANDSHEKMSEVLLDFIEPYRNAPNNKAAFEKLIAIAITTWNVCLLPKDERTDVLNTIFQDMDENLKPELDALFAALIQRKKLHFADYKRFIVDYQISRRGDGDYTVGVASLPFSDSQQPHE